MDYKEPSVLDMQSGTSGTAADRVRAPAAHNEEMDEQLEFDFNANERIVENEATKKAAHWTVNNKSLWARFTDRRRLPQKLAKKAARQCASSRSLLSCILCSAFTLCQMTVCRFWHP